MIDVSILLEGLEPVFEDYREITRILAEQENRETMLVAWSDKKRNTHSPSCVRCQVGEVPGWEVYGRNHEGRLRISVNNDEYVFIYT